MRDAQTWPWQGRGAAASPRLTGAHRGDISVQRGAQYTIRPCYFCGSIEPQLKSLKNSPVTGKIDKGCPLGPKFMSDDMTSLSSEYIETDREEGNALQ